jgi:serine/threonine protein kinase
MTWQTGSELDGRYRLDTKIGEGGMGEVWRGRQLAVDRDVAIKFLGTQLATNEEVRERFRHEARITANLSSRHAVQVFDFGVTADGEPYLVMELLNGEPLSRRIEREGRLTPAVTVSFLRDAARALTKAHASGIVHRDFKPDNVFLTDTDGIVEVKVVDFGIAKLIGSFEATRPTDVDLAKIKANAHLTRTGRLVGTPPYMGPEQVRMDADIGPAADIWALGVVAYECLTGRCPFDGDNVLELFTNIQLYNWTSALKVVPTLPASFDDWFRKVCAPEPADRFRDANLAVDALAVALHLDMPRDDRMSDGSRLRFDSVSEGMMPVRYATPSKENLLDGGAELFSKATLLNASVPVRQKGGKGPWVAVGVSCLAIAGLAAVRSSMHHPAASPSAATQRTHQEVTVVSSGVDAGARLEVGAERSASPSVSSPALIRPEGPGVPPSSPAAAAPDGGTVPTSAVRAARRLKPAEAPAASVPAAPSAAPAPAPAASPTPVPTSTTTNPFKNPALGI